MANNTYYQSLRFLFSIEMIKPNYDVQPEIRGGDLNWRPPTIPEAITTTVKTGWLKWTYNGVTKPTTVSNEDFQVCSLFYNSESCQYLGVPYDCRKVRIQDKINAGGERYGWRRIMFEHHEYDPPHPSLSIMKFDSEHHVLASRGSRTWMPQLIPQSYCQNQPDSFTPPETALAGDIALFIALATFTCRIPETKEQLINFVRMIGSSFKPPRWVPHQLPSGRMSTIEMFLDIFTRPTDFF